MRYRSSRAARPVRPARKRGLPSHPYPISRRLKASYNQGSVAGACRAVPLRHEELLERKGLYYAMWRQQVGERRPAGSVPARLAGVAGG